MKNEGSMEPLMKHKNHNQERKSFFMAQVLDFILTRSTRNLEFHGHTENPYSNDSSSRCNVFSVGELLATYDTVLQESLNKSKNQTKYLSPKMQNDLPGSKVINWLAKEITRTILFHFT
ncbi:hypothetical protein CEXT_501781 [Caerostris extrusa]|uniref:Uncharacterized protein n=1 Tax=Caerostris extrusa TaxID=172846 RepID=A0AAV4Y170_CAEEX|nr:hypothetical protein CEXT_501781 [Caerostris extrusa]